MSKESSIKVFAENASGTRPANAIPVWIDNISAIGGGGGGGSSDTFYIYPGKTTDKEISENSGKDLKLYNSANNVFLDFAGKSTFGNSYAIFSFKEITGTQYNFNTVQHLRLKVYPNATSACKVYDTNIVNLLDTNSNVNQAETAYYDGNGNSLAQTRNELTALNQFIQSNSANWGGGSAPAGEGVLFHSYRSFDQNDGSEKNISWVSGATELYFEAFVGSEQGTPNYVSLARYGSEIGRAYWTQVSSDGSYNYFTASYINSDGGDIEIQKNGMDYDCYVSANGVKTHAFNQGGYYCSTGDEVKFNVQGSNITGTINVFQQGNITPLTSFTGSLIDFTAKGYVEYRTYISNENNNSFDYDLSAAFGAGGSTVASGNVFPPTNNLDPWATYYLGWNANNGGLFWYEPGNGGN